MDDRSLQRELERLAADPLGAGSPLRALAEAAVAGGAFARAGEHRFAGQRRADAAFDVAAVAVRLAAATGTTAGDLAEVVAARVEALRDADAVGPASMRRPTASPRLLAALGRLAEAVLALGEAAEGEGWMPAALAFAGPQALEALRDACVELAAAALAA